MPRNMNRNRNRNRNRNYQSGNNNIYNNNNYANNLGQQDLLNFYMNLYNQTSRQIDLLYLSLDDIRDNINTISGVNRQITTSSLTLNNPRPNLRPGPNQGPIPNTMEYNYVVNPITTENLPVRFFNNYLTDVFHSFNNSIPIIPSQNVLNSATRAYRYSDIITPINSNCPITLERFENNSDVTMLLGCGHIFTTPSITSWFTSNVRCPVCRYDIRDYIHPNTTAAAAPASAPAAAPTNPLAQNLLNNLLNDTSNNLITSGLIGLSALGINSGRFMFDASNDELVFEGFAPPPRNNNV
jgi:hypothetical protein